MTKTLFTLLIQTSQQFISPTTETIRHLLNKPLLQSSILASVILLGSITGCQPATAPADSTPTKSSESLEGSAADHEDSQTSSVAPNADHPTLSSIRSPSAAAQARIDEYEPKFVATMLRLQQRLQAEFEALQAADSPEPSVVAAPLATPTQPSGENISTQVGERDLTVLKQISLEPRPPQILSSAQLKARYQQAFKELYSTDMLSAQAANTLINITTLLPDLFEQTQLAQQLSEKSPALARLVVQHQVWRQIEAQHVEDMQQMKRDQQAEFEALMAKFNQTIAEYDDQIAKYEQTLKEFEK